ncbi:hypothetical protein AB0284_21460 [Pseudarthrobacter phenanthrenivorans]|uniref:hypothetical protein n=1 Tax=Pseudarthrobacter phenanthrenivorans TaxID=361575 RepID=UPI00344CE8F1
MPAEEVKARCQSIADAINAIPETDHNFRELRRARGEIDALTRDLGEPEAKEAGDD